MLLAINFLTSVGVAWQETLYSSIDNSRCVVALISPEYQESAVCQEEINLALAKHFSKVSTSMHITISAQ
jgi:hypothetical protein